MKTQICIVGDVGDGFRSLTTHQIAGLQSPHHASFNFWRTFHFWPNSSGESERQLWRLSDISGTVGKKWKPRSSGIFPTYENQAFSEGYSRARLFIDYFSWPCELFKNAHACALRDCLGVSRPFVSDTSPKCIDREGLKRRRTGTRQSQYVTDTWMSANTRLICRPIVRGAFNNHLVNSIGERWCAE